MREVCSLHTNIYRRMVRSQDIIGWRRFMEGMISQRMVEVQQEYFELNGTGWKLEKWAAGLSVRLLEITHGQWLYRNVLVHDKVSGSHARARKEDIAAQIEAQLIKGGEDLLAEDSYLMEVNLDDLSDSSGESHEYWLLAITAARQAAQLRREGHPSDGTDYG